MPGRLENVGTKQRHLVRGLIPCTLYATQRLEEDGELIEEAICRRCTLLVALVPLCGSVDGPECLEKACLRNQPGKIEFCLIPNVFLPACKDISERLLLWIGLREEVVRRFEQSNMGEVPLRPTVVVRILQIDTIAGREILRHHDHRIWRPEEFGKCLLGLLALPHLRS